MKKVSLVALMLLFIGTGAFAQEEEPVVTAKVTSSVASFRPGETFPFQLELNIRAPYHINSEQPMDEFLVPTSVIFQDQEGLTFATPEFPPAELKTLGFSQSPVSIYEGTLIISCRVTLASDWNVPEAEIAGIIEYQACDDSACLPPADLKFSRTFVVEGGKTAPSPKKPLETPPAKVEKSVPKSQAPAEAAESVPEKVESLVQEGAVEEMPAEGSFARTVGERGLFLTFLVVFIGGLALNLTPCVYPLIPITIGYFGGQAQGRRGGVVAHALLYVLGMAMTYSALGVIAALTGSLFGAALQNPYVLIGIAVVLVALALSMFDLYEFRLPDFLTNLAGGRKSGYAGTFFMGLTVGFVAAPCIGPFVLGLLTYVGERGDILLGFLLFFVLALGLGLPFLFLGIFSGNITRLPRSGAWMVWVRSIFGFVLLGMAVYFLRPLFPHALSYHLTLALLFLIGGIYMAWIEPTKLDGKVFPAIRTVFGVLFFIGALVTSVSGIQAYIHEAMDNAQEQRGSALRADEIHWRAYSEDRLADAKEQAKPVMIDFYADWCIPCKELDKVTFVQPEIVEISRNFVMLKADMTSSRDPLTKKTQRRFKIKGVPTLILLMPDGSEAVELRTVGFIHKDNLLAKMQKILQKAQLP